MFRYRFELLNVKNNSIKFKASSFTEYILGVKKWCYIFDESIKIYYIILF